MAELIPLNDLLKQIVDSLYLCVVVDAGCTIRYISSGYSALLGMDEKELLGRPVLDILPNSRLPEVVRTGRELLGDVIVMKNGDAAVCSRFPIIGEDGAVWGAFSTATFQNTEIVERLNGEVERLRRENDSYRRRLERMQNPDGFLDFVTGRSAAIREIKQTIGRVADSNLTVLMTGETGVGKEAFSDALYQLSNRRFAPYIKVNCAAIPQGLLESELFGYEAGAVPGGAKGGKPGKFEQANHGTILLDEIGELPLQLQSKLLRVLQEREVERIGGQAPIQIDTRVICNTNQNLQAMIAAGTFRRDLYYRICVVELQIPPLRQRVEDIPDLCDFLLKKINRRHGCHVFSVSPEMMQLFETYDWPGNVRELEHVLERAAVMSNSSVLDADSFLFFTRRILDAADAAKSGALQDLRWKAEADAIRDALRKTKGNKTKAAQLLKIPRSLLYQKMKRYHIDGEAGP